jgi:hypothetical protein
MTEDVPPLWLRQDPLALKLWASKVEKTVSGLTARVEMPVCRALTRGGCKMLQLVLPE